MKPRIPVFAALTAFLSFVLPAIGAFHTIEIEGSAFNPPTLTVETGDTVTWINRDFVGHTVTGDTAGEPFCGQQTLFQNGTCMRRFDTVGTFTYHCIPHPFMTASVTVEQGGPKPPTVAITSPANGATFTGAPNTNVSITATATDEENIVTNVQFFAGTTSLGSDTNAPYELTANFGLGQHILTAIATDDSGAQATSAPVTITIMSPRVSNPVADRIPKGDISIELQVIAEGLQSPLGFAVPDDTSGRIFLYEQAGLIWVLNNGVKVATPALDLRSRLVLLGPYDERGLLGVAVHTNFANNPLIYTYTSEPISGTADFPSTATNKNHQSVIAEWPVDPANPFRIDAANRREILRIDRPQSNHNGGTMRFGHDGFLYISSGDGGNADDQGDGHLENGNAQSLDNVLGKVLRIDVNARTSANGQYGIPADNPFVGVAGIDEIYAYGLRNPFSFSFDRANGTLYLGDVGQNQLEELNVITSGKNYGWRVKEGTFYFDPNGSQPGYVTTIPIVPEPPNLIDPIAQYDHDDGLAIVGGYVYRGSAVSGLAGKYVTGDWGGNFFIPSGRLLYLDTGNVFKEFRIGRDDRPLGEFVKGFGEGPDGEIYVCVGKGLGPVGTSGRVLKIVPVSPEVAITRSEPSGGNLNVDWTGGNAGPYALQKKDALTDFSWHDLVTTASHSGSARLEAVSGFFRVADVGNNTGIPFSTVLSGGFERPPVTTSATGFGTFRIEGNQLYVDLRYAGLSGAAFAAHIHGPANMSEGPAGVLIDLGGLNGGAWGTSGTLSGAVTLTPEHKALILDGKTYINIHTPSNGGGEIRGQIVPVLMHTFMSGLNERPPHATPAVGQSTMFLVGTQLTFNITYKNLTAPASLAHIHGAADSISQGGIFVDLLPYHNGPFAREGSFTGTVPLMPTVYTSVVDRLSYVNVHSGTYPNGEIRGQIIPKPSAIPLTASLSGGAQQPSPVATPGTGFGSFRIESDDLLFEISYTNLNSQATAANIYGPATATGTGPILIDLAPFLNAPLGRRGSWSGTVPLTPAQKTMILNGQTYLNILTVGNATGEIRGQIGTVLMSASLNGNNERPDSVPTAGGGQGTLLLVGNRLWMDVTYRNLTQPATLARINGPANPFVNANALIDLGVINGGSFGTSGSLAGVITVTSPVNLGRIVDGLTFINISSAFRTTGEIRGQIVR